MVKVVERGSQISVKRPQPLAAGTPAVRNTAWIASWQPRPGRNP